MRIEELYMKGFRDQGPVKLETGAVLRGSDPEIQYEDGHWHLFLTWGPTNASLPYSPGIYLCRSKELSRGYSRKRLVLDPTEFPEEEVHGFETFSCDFVEPLGRWLGMFTASGPGKKNPRIVPVWMEHLSELSGHADWQHALRPEGDWTGDRIGESGVCWSQTFKAIALCYGGKSKPPHTKWSTGFAASSDFGQTWIRQSQPFADPPHTFEDGSGTNAMAHSTCAEDPHEPYVLHCVTTHSGNTYESEKGLIHWIYQDAVWRRQPGFLIQPTDIENATNVGGPSLLYRHDIGKWMLAIHVENKREGVPRHIRILLEKD